MTIIFRSNSECYSYLKTFLRIWKNLHTNMLRKLHTSILAITVMQHTYCIKDCLMSADCISNSSDQSRDPVGRKGAPKWLSLRRGLDSRDAFPLTNFLPLPNTLSSLVQSHTHPTSQLVTFGSPNIYHVPSRHMIGTNEIWEQITSWQRLG